MHTSTVYTLIGLLLSHDPDVNITGKNPLSFNWFQYREITDGFTNTVASLPKLNFTLSDDGKVVTTKMPTREKACALPTGLQASYGITEVCQEYHVILEVTGSEIPPIRRYRRVILKIDLDDTSASSATQKRDEL